MIGVEPAAWIVAALLGVVALFQLALAAGAPWGSLAMGGRFPGRMPPAMRVAALVQIGLYVLMALVILSRAGAGPVILGPPDDIGVAAWVVVGVMALAVVMNLITPSRWERRIWAPVALLILLGAIRVASA